MGFMVWRGLPCQARGRERALMTKRNKDKYLRMRSRISSRGFDRGRIKEGGCIVGRVERVLTAGTLVANGWWHVYLRSAWSSPTSNQVSQG